MAKAAPKTYLNPQPTKGYARNPELEGIIRTKPDDSAPYLVYADWLSQQGDPRGELIVLQHKLSTPGQGGEGAAIATRADEILAQNESFLGGIVTGQAPKHFQNIGDGVVTVTWKWGFIESARLFNTMDWMDGKFPARDVCTRLFNVPAAAFMKELKVGVLRWEYQNEDVKALIEEASKAPFASDLRVFRLGDVSGIDIDCAHHPLGDLSGIGKAFPNLRELTMWGCEFTLGESLDLAKLEKLKVETCGLSKANLDAVTTNAKLPALEYLDVWFGSEDYGNDCSMDDIAPLLQKKLFPKLKHLGLKNTELADDIAQAIGTASILPQLTTLDLSMGTLSEVGARALIESRAALKHLESINVSQSFLTADIIAELGKIGPKIIADDQKDMEDDYRYVSVAE